jgi:hypothetical protein
LYQSVLPHIPSRQVPPEIAARRAAARTTAAVVDNGRGRAAAHERAPNPTPADTAELLAEIAARETDLDESCAFL